MNPELSIDTELLELDFGQTLALNRRSQVWLLALVALVIASTVMLAFFLRAEESSEETRQRIADTEWLEQTLRFHFRRLEDDLKGLALRVRKQGELEAQLPRAGSLWRSTGVIVAHEWVAANAGAVDTPGARLPSARVVAQHADNTDALEVMLDTARALQRPAYAGPMLRSGAGAGSMLWMAVPIVEQGQFVGSYVAAIDLAQALDAAVPAWFLQDHRVQLQTEGRNADAAESLDALHYSVPVNLNGAELRLHVDVTASHPQLGPRAFFGIAVLGLAGMLLAIFLFFRDTVRRARAESQLKTQIAIRTAMERSVTLGLRAWDLHGRPLYVNQAFCRLVGWDAKTLLSAANPPPYWPIHQEGELVPLQKGLGNPELHSMGKEHTLLHRDGHALHVLMHYAPLTLQNGTTIGWIGSTLDITERRLAERQALRQQEILEASGRLIAVGEVASTLAHELNQPLGALSSFANGLLNRIRSGAITLDEVLPIVERMEKMAEKAGRVIQRVNAFARRQDMSRQPVELVPFVRRVAEGVGLASGVTLSLDLPSADLTIAADALLLEHAVHNVVLNAGEWGAKNPDGQGSVRISVVEADTMVGICVEDNGPGVPPEKRGSIFNAFTSNKDGGMGMGLAICRSIVEAHNGRIDVDSSATLGGAQFTLWLPLNP